MSVRSGVGIPPSKRRKRELDRLLRLYANESGTGRLLGMVRLREYVRMQDPYIVRDEIRGIDDEQDINVLIGVGMKGILYYECIKQKAKCVGL